MSEHVSYNNFGFENRDLLRYSDPECDDKHNPLCQGALAHRVIGVDAGLAQRLEHRLYTPGAGGSNPSACTTFLESAACADPRHAADCPRHTAFHTIPLTRGYSAVVDPKGFERFGHLKWTAAVQRRSDGSLRVYAYRNVWGVDGKCRTTFLHRAVVDAKPGERWDHEDRNTLNCCEYNLRLATGSQNAANRTITKPSKFGFIGIDSQTPGTFRGRVHLDGRNHYTKTFRCPRQAAQARDALAVKLQGEFCVLNFPAQAGEQCA